MAKEGDDKKESKKWHADFAGATVYNKNGVKVIEPLDKKTPFSIVIVGNQKKIVPKGTDISKVDVKKLPDLDMEDYDKNLKNLGVKDLAEEPKLDEKSYTDWNDMVDYMKEKGYAGNPKMNNVDFSKKAFNEYKTAHPESSLTYDHVLPMQKLIHQYREKGLDKLNKGEATLDEPLKPDGSNFMEAAGTELGKKEDGILGEKTSITKVPSEFMNNKKPENRIGFVPTPDEEKAGKKVIGDNGNQPAMKTGTGIFNAGKRVAEMFEENGKNILRFRNDTSYTGEETEVSKEDIPKYLGTTNAFQSDKMYNELKSKGKKPEPVTASTQK